MTKLYITRGLPGSGKSTWARTWVAEDPKHRAEVNRDQLRIMLHGGYADAEVRVTVAQHSVIRDLLKQGVDVVSSDTNLYQRHARELAKIARRAGADVEVMDFTDVPLETCIERDSYRAKALGDDKNPVGERVIRRMHGRFIAGRNGKPLPSPVEDEYHGVPNFVERIPGLHSAVIVDIDGTVALKGDRNPHDLSRVHEDRPNHPVIEAVRAAYVAGHEIVFLSGREGTDECRRATTLWLNKHVHVPYIGPYMRPAGDFRKDSIVKRELFDKHIRGNFNVAYVLDDRDQVVEMWREELGMTCMQVAKGDF